MNPKQAIIIAFFALIFSCASAQTDLTPTGNTSTNGTTVPGYDYACIQSNAAISQLNAKVDTLQAQMLKTSDLLKIKDEFIASLTGIVNEIIVRQVTVLFVFSIFFFSLLFLTIAKGWWPNARGK